MAMHIVKHNMQFILQSVTDCNRDICVQFVKCMTVVNGYFPFKDCDRFQNIVYVYVQMCVYVFINYSSNTYTAVIFLTYNLTCSQVFGFFLNIYFADKQYFYFIIFYSCIFFFL